MDFIIVSCVFSPEPGISAQTSAQLARELVNQGHKVTVISPFPNRPGGQVYPGYKRRLIQKESSPDGFEIIRCFSSLSPNSSLGSRFLENITFGFTSGLCILCGRRPYAIYSNTWPIFATGILAVLAALRRIPVVLSIQDIYPESLIIQGRIKRESALAHFLRWVDRMIARSSRAIVVISHRFARIYRNDRKVTNDKLHIVPNWMQVDTINLDEDRSNIRRIHNVPESSKLFVYAGNIGAAAGVETVIEAFRFLMDQPDVYLLIAGEGSSLENCRRLAALVGNDRVLFHSPWHVEDTSRILLAGDVLVLPTCGAQSLVSVPSKLISYLLASQPVLALALPESDVTATLLEANCGWIVEPDNPQAVADIIKEISKLHSEELRVKGIAGRDYALRNFAMEINLPRVVQILQEAGQ